MDSSEQLCIRCWKSYRKTYANFRSLIAAYLRGEIDHEVFQRCVAEVALLHDMEIAHCQLSPDYVPGEPLQ